MKRLVELALFLVLAVTGFILFSWSGLYSVAASEGHWPAVGWLLRYTMQNSVETHALLLEAPPLTDAALVERGAGHYETGCASCHGAPGWASGRIPDNMLPEPPYLPTHIEKWTAEELFWLVKHGLKYTGMPSWPALSRDDEVWAVTAFLLRLPDMSAAEYNRLAMGAGEQVPVENGEPAVPESPGELFPLADAVLIGSCARCHGVDGAGRPSGAFPRLDIQSADYLYRSLTEYASEVRPSGIMGPVAAALDEASMRQLAEHYAEQTGGEAASGELADSSILNRGLELAMIGAPERQIPPCASCHGTVEGPKNPMFPALAGQYADYIRLQLELFKQGVRTGGPYSNIMSAVAAHMTEADMHAAASYYAALSADDGGVPQAAAGGEP
jgi:cytochrome c553